MHVMHMHDMHNYCRILKMSRKRKGDFASIDSPTFQTVLGRIITRARKQAGVDQISMALSVGVTQSTWSRIERGESTMNVDQLFQVSRALEVSLDHLMSDAETVLGELEKYGLTIRESTDTTPVIFNIRRSTNLKLLDRLINSMIRLSE